jgi:hypothetical protein
LIFSLIIVEIVTLLPPFRRNPRYVVMYLPLFYLVAANAAIYLLVGGLRLLGVPPRRRAMATHPLTALFLVGLAVLIGYNDLRVALLTPEPAYEQAFAVVLERWQPGDTIYTMNTAAAELYLRQVDGFTIQNDAEQFLLDNEGGAVDRWAGAPWIGTVSDFNRVLNRGGRVWFVIDSIRLPVYFRGNWQALLATDMEQVWSGENVMVYRNRPDSKPLPEQPANELDVQFEQGITLAGVTVEDEDSQAVAVTFFWQPEAVPPADYTVFLHLRDESGATVAQLDRQPLNGLYPTSQWQPGEVIPDRFRLPISANLPAGRYQLVAGLYRLDTLARLAVMDDSSGENAVLLGEINRP